jgi:hypothetical protein
LDVAVMFGRVSDDPWWLWAIMVVVCLVLLARYG